LNAKECTKETASNGGKVTSQWVEWFRTNLEMGCAPESLVAKATEPPKKHAKDHVI
jgi:hypothetical protein